MKKLYFAIFALISGNAFCQTIIDFEDFTLNGSETHFDGSDMSGSSDGIGHFETIYTSGTLTFNSIYDTTWGATSGYWSTGWAFSNETPDNQIGYAGLFGSYAGGGDNSNNYVIGQNESVISSNYDLVQFESIRITNNNYAASSMLNGDSFGKKFGGASGDDQDWFLLTIVGYNANDIALDSVEVYLADYRFSDNSQDYILKDWTTVNLTSIGNSDYIKFKLTSSDNTGGYMNTPAFFAVDNVVEDAIVSVAEGKLNKFSLYPNPSSNVINISNTISNQEILITNIHGQAVKSIISSENMTSINIADLPKGSYLLTVLSTEGKITKKFQKI